MAWDLWWFAEHRPIFSKSHVLFLQIHSRQEFSCRCNGLSVESQENIVAPIQQLAQWSLSLALFAFANTRCFDLVLEHWQKYITKTKAGRLGQTGYRATVKGFNLSLSWWPWLFQTQPWLYEEFFHAISRFSIFASATCKIKRTANFASVACKIREWR